MNRRKARVETFILLFQYEFHGTIDEILDDFFTNHTNPIKMPDDIESADWAYFDYRLCDGIKDQGDYIRQICERFSLEHEKIDEMIEKHSKNWKKDRISMVSLAVLRVAICEMLYFSHEIPAPVSITEALEIVKSFEGTEAISYVNGVLEGVRVDVEVDVLGGDL